MLDYILEKILDVVMFLIIFVLLIAGLILFGKFMIFLVKYIIMI